jgi:thiosulfate reductase/polysulfide reductase chain A
VAAHVTEFIHPDAVFTVHGFGREIPRQTRNFMAGLSDQKLMVGKLDDWDQAGGGVNLCEAFVHVSKSIRNTKRRAEL